MTSSTRVADGAEDKPPHNGTAGDRSVEQAVTNEVHCGVIYPFWCEMSILLCSYQQWLMTSFYGRLCLCHMISDHAGSALSI